VYPGQTRVSYIFVPQRPNPPGSQLPWLPIPTIPDLSLTCRLPTTGYPGSPLPIVGPSQKDIHAVQEFILVVLQFLRLVTWLLLIYGEKSLRCARVHSCYNSYHQGLYNTQHATSMANPDTGIGSSAKVPVPDSNRCGFQRLFQASRNVCNCTDNKYIIFNIYGHPVVLP
jgi:hypothetical protein